MAGQQDKHGKAAKARRNFRINGSRRGPSPDHSSETKWRRSGGVSRMSKRKARRHGCGLPAMHQGKHGQRDRAHSGMR